MSASLSAGPLRAVLLALALWVTLALTAVAQPAERPDYDTWSQISEAAESTLENDDISVDRLEELRARIASWRNAFLDAQDINASRIATLQGQLNALGPPPEEGAPPEPAEIAERRETLNAQLDELRAPVVSAQDAYTLADGLIAQIDSTIREQYTRALLAREATPLNPVYWAPAIGTLVEAWTIMSREVAANLADPDVRSRALNTLAAAVPLAVIGLLLIFRSRWWVRLFAGWAVRRSMRGRGVLEFVLSLGQVVFPLIGVYIFASALRLTGLVGPQMDQLVQMLPEIALPIIATKWLTLAVFPTDPDEHGPLGLPLAEREGLRFYGNTLAILVSILILIDGIGLVVERSGILISVLQFVPRVLLCIALYRFGRILMRARPEDPADAAGASKYGAGVQHLLGRLVAAIAVAVLILAVFGYANAAQALLRPTAMTLALIALLLVLQKLASDFYAFLTGRPEGQTDALAPVLIGFVLTLAALPVFALIWGARVTDLTEVWSRFRAGFAIGETRISPGDFATFLLVFAFGYILTRFVQGTLRNTILPKTGIDVGGRNAIVAGLGYIGIFIAALVAITTAGIDLSNLAIVAGALSVGIGFGLQNVVSNFVSGIILLIERPISEGDWIEVNGYTGYVRGISVRSTRIETFDRTDVIVPNADLVSGTVTNWTRGNLVGRLIVPVGVAYGADTRKVEAILQEVADAHPMVVLNPPPFVYFAGFGSDSMNFEIRAILRDVNFILQVHSEMNHAIVGKLAEAGIAIPFPQRDIWLRNPETLRPGAPVATDSRA